MKKLSILLVVVLIIVFGLVACVPMQAEAAEEQATATNSVYYNYTITCNNAPVFFQYPTYEIDNSQMLDFYNSNVVAFQTVEGQTRQFIDMIYVLKHLDGTIYYQSVVRISNSPFIDMIVGNNFPAPNYNSSVGVSNLGTMSFTRISELDSNLYAPSITFSTVDNYKLKLFFSSVPGNVALDELVLSAINLRDYLFYAYNTNTYPNAPLANGAPWLDFYFTQSTPNTRQIQVATITSTQSSDPTYPIIQSYNSIYNYGFDQGFDVAFDQGYNEGYKVGSDEGFDLGFDNGFDAGEDVGFDQGVLEANDYSFLGLFTAVVDAPVTVIRETFDFNILGFNLSTFIFSILTLCLVIALIKKLV